MRNKVWAITGDQAERAQVAVNNSTTFKNLPSLMRCIQKIHTCMLWYLYRQCTP